MRNLVKCSFFALTILATACASTSSKDLDQKLATHESVRNREELKLEAAKLIENSRDLSNDQKAQLDKLRASVSSKLDDLGGQSLKLRSVLVEDLLAPAYLGGEISQVKARMQTVEEKRLAVIFDGVDQANAILGHLAPLHREAILDLFRSHSSFRE